MSHHLLRVLGDGPFRDVGRPLMAAEAGEAVVVVGDLGVAASKSALVPGADVAGTGTVVTVVDRATLEPRLVASLPLEASCLAIRPDGRAALVGTVGFERGAWTGELHLLDLDRPGDPPRPLLATPCAVDAVRWLDERTLEMVVGTGSATEPEGRRVVVGLEPGTAGSLHAAGAAGAPATVLGWDRARRERERADAARLVADTAAAAGRRWELRRLVWDLEPVGDGVVACGDRVAGERWTATSGDPAWRVGVDGVGVQVATHGDRLLVTVEHDDTDPDPGELIDLTDFSEVRVLDPGSGHELESWGREDAVATTVAGEAVLVRARDGGSRLVTADGVRPVRLDVPLPETHHLDLVGAPEVLVADEGWGRPVALGAVVPRPLRRSARVARRVVLAPGEAVRAGVRLTDPDGYALATVVREQGEIVDNALRRVADDLRTRTWETPLPGPAVAVDARAGRLLVACAPDHLLCLDAATGAERWRDRIRVHDRPATVTCLRYAADGTAYAGLRDGRILHLRVD